MGRIPSVRIAAQASPFDPLALSRAGAVGTAIVAPIAEGLAAKADAMAQMQRRQGELFAQVEAARIDRELAADLEGVRNTMPETGAGYAKMAMDREERRYQDALARAGDDPVKRRALEERHALDREERRASFEKAERDFSRAYALNQHVLTLDDEVQQVARGDYGASPAGQGDTLQVIRGFEGFRPDAYWDVNAWRTGYGSDTVTRADGTVERVTETTTVTREDADRDLARRSAEFAKGVVSEIGLDSWQRLSSSQRATLTSLAYNYGSLPDGVASAVRGMGDVGAAIRALKDHNGGINAGRRETEANIWETGYAGGVDQYGLPNHTGDTPDVWKNPLMINARDVVFDQINSLPITNAERADLRRQAEAQLVQSALGAMGRSNPSGALAAINSGQYDRYLTVKETDELSAKIIKEAKDREEVFREEAKARAANRQAWYDGNMQGEAPPELTPEEFNSLTAADQRDYEDASTIASARMRAMAVPLSNAQALLDGLTPDPASPNYAAGVKAKEAAAKVVADRQEAAVVETHVGAALAAGIAPDMGRDGVKKRVGELFQAAVAGSENPLQAAAEFVTSRRVAPEGFGGMIAQAMSSDDPAMATAAVETVARINAVDPRILAGAANGQAIDRAAAVAEYVALGVPAKEAFEFTRAMVDPSRAGERKAREAAWAADKGAMEEAALEAFTSRLQERGKAKYGLGSSEALAAIPAGVWSEYSDLVKGQYALTGNVQVAVAAAERAFYASHGVTRVGGVPQWQKGAPEALYAVYGDERDSAWINEQAVSFASSALGKTVESVTLQPVSDPLRTRGLSYTAIALTADGEALPVPGAFTPDPVAVQPVAQARSEQEAEAFAARSRVVSLQVDKLVAWRKLQELPPSAPASEREALLKSFRDADPLIRDARKRRDALEANLKGVSPGVNLSGALPAIAP